MMATRELKLAIARQLKSVRSSGLRIIAEKYYRREFFSVPSQLWEHRSERDGLRIKHKKNNLPRVEAELAAMTPRSLQSNISAWNIKLARSVKAKEYGKTIRMFEHMLALGMDPNQSTFIPVLKACSGMRALEHGRWVHSQIIQSQLGSNVSVESCVVDMYAKCGSIVDAWSVFENMPVRDVVSWNTMLMGFVKSGKGQDALRLFRRMPDEGVKPNQVTLIGALNACASVAAIVEGRCIHKQIIRSGYESDVSVCNALVDMYAKCGGVDDALGVFDKMATRDVVSWNAMIGGFVKCGFAERALELFHKMQRDRVEPTPVTFVAVFNACSSVLALEEGRRIHAYIIQRRYETNVFVSSSLVDMYAKCGSIEDAWMVFNKMPAPNVVSWTSMILGYVNCGNARKGMELFRKMQQESVNPNIVTFVAVLNACAGVGALKEGRHIHEEITERGLESDVRVGNSLVDMYAKCGSIEDALKVFEKMPLRDVVSWTAMLGGYAMHGLAREAQGHFERMCEEDVQVNSVTFVVLLSACSHSGLVDEGLCYFESMSSVFGVPATVDHFSCLVDLLGRAGRLYEALDLINTMVSCERNAGIWMSLLGACRIYAKVELGELVAKRVLEICPKTSAGYVLLSNIYAAAGKWDGSASLKRERLLRGVTKTPGRTWIEVKGEVHSFVADDNEHPEISEIHQELDRMVVLIKEAGYMPDTSFVLHDWDEEEKVSSLCRHSEKLAVVYGLMSTPPRTPLHIYKNLRVCGDCHTAMKFMAKVAGRPIIMRDAKRFHHFREGLCSCRDYW